MNDIAHASKRFDFIIYADDTTLPTTIELIVKTTTNLPISDILSFAETDQHIVKTRG